MLVITSFARSASQVVLVSGFPLALNGPALGQVTVITPNPGNPYASDNIGMLRAPQNVTITVAVRDARGLPIEDLAIVHLSSKMRGVHQSGDTKSSADVSFGVLEGPYEVQVECPGYRTVKQELTVYGGSGFFNAYIYLHTEDDPSTTSRTAPEIAFKPKALTEVDKGLVSMRKKQYQSARNHFDKASQISPSSSDVFYLRGTAELSLKQSDQARRDFEQAIVLEPGHEKALLALGQMQLDGGDAKGAIATLNRSFTANGASWRTYYLLATAYFRMKQWNQAASAAIKSANLAHNLAAIPLLLLGDIQLAAGDTKDAKESWEKLISTFPNDPLAADAKNRVEQADSRQTAGATEVAAIALPAEPPVVKEHPWAPPDVDSKDYLVTAAACSVDDVLGRAMIRVKSQLANLEKFTATENIEHQDIDKSGQAGPIKSRKFSYIVFVLPFQQDSVFLEESRDGQANTAAFPTSLATVGLNSLGVSILQPVYRPGFEYQCEGLSSIRGGAAWQVRFEEKKDSNTGVRRWQRQGTIYNIPIKGRIWLSTTTYDILRVETDLREAQAELELRRDHLEVNYGPVKFAATDGELWLPWNAEMYLELHGKRYHHRHILSDYMLFGIDTTNKIGAPKNAPNEAPAQNEPETAPQKPPTE